MYIQKFVRMFIFWAKPEARPGAKYVYSKNCWNVLLESGETRSEVCIFKKKLECFVGIGEVRGKACIFKKLPECFVESAKSGAKHVYSENCWNVLLESGETRSEACVFKKKVGMFC